MPTLILSTLLTIITHILPAQQVDSIYFNLYTDSLKKGKYNYINVDAKYSNGKYLPLIDGEVIFTTTYGTFEKNCLVLPADTKQSKVTITIALKKNTAITQTTTIYIKQKPDDEVLPTVEEIMQMPKKKTETTTTTTNKTKRRKSK